MLEVAVRVPDHGRVTPWRLQVLTRQAQQELGDAFAKEFTEAEPRGSGGSSAPRVDSPQRSPVLVIVSSRIVPDREGVPPVEQLLSCGNVCFNLLHAATALGYGAQWVTNWPAYNENIKAVLGIPPDDHLVGFVHIGTPKGPPQERQRPEITDVVSHLDSLP